MTPDYDAPRTAAAESADESLEGLAARRDAAVGSAVIDVDDTAEVFDLPGAEILDEELAVTVVPMRADEFRCPRCFLIHLSRLAVRRDGQLVCQECA